MPKIPAVDRRVLRYAVEVTSRGEVVEPEAVAYALVPSDRRPTVTTAWTVTPLVDGEIEVLVAGPEAGPGEGATGPRGSYKLHVRALDNPESITEVADVITFY